MSKLARSLLVALLVCGLGVGAWFLLKRSAEPLAPTVADLEAVHAGVTVSGDEVRGVRRLAAGDPVRTDAEGRARLRLDDGTSCILDRDTELVVGDQGLELERGRVFVLGAPGATSTVRVAGASVLVKAANAGFDMRSGRAKIYSANEEIVIVFGGRDTKVRAGETASIESDTVAVAPEKAFDDWTGGLAAPWGAQGKPRRAVGELWGRPSPGDVGSPLTLRAHDVAATVAGEVATTSVRSTYFNGGSQGVAGDFRMAVPPGAIVSKFAWGTGEDTEEAVIAAARRNEQSVRPTAAVLEWAGESWLRGHLPSIPSGATATVVVEYVEWLHPVPSASGNLRLQYRYPMASDATPPLIGEFSARVDAGASNPISIAAGYGAKAEKNVVEIRRPDFRPVADLVVDVEVRQFGAPARLYVADAPDDETGDGPVDRSKTVLVRTELPDAEPDAGATLVLVVDTSGSAETSVLDASRAFVEAVLAGLGERDRALVLAADQTARPVGPGELGPVDDARRKAILADLATLSPGGATDLGGALEAAADALPSDAHSGLVVYVGDGWQTVGDPTVDRIRSRLARRGGGGPPRIATVAVGPLANRTVLAALSRGSGPLLEVTDSSDAAAAAVALIGGALKPAVAGVEVRFGTEVEQVYPRTARAVVAGDTVTAVGRARGELPTSVVLRWQGPEGPREEVRQLEVMGNIHQQDVRRRWAKARVEEIVLAGKGREAAIDVALRSGLITPWTGFRVGSGPYVASALSTRVLDLSSGAASRLPAVFATPRGRFGALTNVPHEVIEDAKDDDGAFKSAVAAAAARVIERAVASVRACRDSRAALRPDLRGSLSVSLEIDGEGRASNVRVRGTSPQAEDSALSRCVQVVVEGLQYPASGLAVRVKVARTIDLPTVVATLRGRKCSATSRLRLPLRRGVWRERMERDKAWDVYVDAKRACELPAWADRRALLELILQVNEAGLDRVDIARQLEAAGESDAAALLRREAVRRARTPAELRAIKVALVGDERFPRGTFRKRYEAAQSDAGRLAVVRRFLSVAPHDAMLRRRLIALLEATGQKDVLVDEIRRIRMDPFADAQLLADSASALRRAGRELEARRSFGELAERAPSDPWARAFLGDRLRNEGWFDDASAAYAALDEMMPDDPGVLIRLALAHRGAGRVDIARRLLSRVAQTGGRAGDAALGELASRLASVLLAEARSARGIAKEDAEQLVAAALEVARPDRGQVVMVRAPAASVPLRVTLTRGADGADEELAPDASAPAAGLYSLRFEPDGASKVVLSLARARELAPARPVKVRVDALLPGIDPTTPPSLVSREVELPVSGRAVELSWADGRWAG